MLTEFKNEALTDFNCKENREKMESALKKVRSELGKKHPLMIGGKAISTEKELVSTNPANPKEVIASFSKATQKKPQTTISGCFQQSLEEVRQFFGQT